MLNHLFDRADGNFVDIYSLLGRPMSRHERELADLGAAIRNLDQSYEAPAEKFSEPTIEPEESAEPAIEVDPAPPDEPDLEAPSIEDFRIEEPVPQ
jgi:hypothetical protein